MQQCGPRERPRAPMWMLSCGAVQNKLRIRVENASSSESLIAKAFDSSLEARRCALQGVTQHDPIPSQRHSLSRYNRPCFKTRRDDSAPRLLLDIMQSTGSSLLAYIIRFFPAVDDEQRQHLTAQLTMLCDQIACLPLQPQLIESLRQPAYAMRRVELDPPQTSMNGSGDYFTMSTASGKDHYAIAAVKNGETAHITHIKVTWDPGCVSFKDSETAWMQVFVLCAIDGSRDCAVERLVRVFNMREECSRHLTEEHIYDIKSMNTVQIKLVLVNGFCGPGDSYKKFKLRSIEAFCCESIAPITDAPPILCSLQKALFDLIEKDYSPDLRALAIRALPTVAHCNVSLRLSLVWVAFLRSREDVNVATGVIAKETFGALLNSLSEEQTNADCNGCFEKYLECLLAFSKDCSLPSQQYLIQLGRIALRLISAYPNIIRSNPTELLRLSYVVDVTSEVFIELASLISTCDVHDPRPDDLPFLISVLGLVNVQVVALEHAKLPATDADITSEALDNVERAVRHLAEHRTSIIQAMAAETYFALKSIRAAHVIELVDLALCSLHYLDSVSSEQHNFIFHVNLLILFLVKISRANVVTNIIDRCVQWDSWLNCILRFCALLIRVFFASYSLAPRFEASSEYIGPAYQEIFKLRGVANSFFKLFQDCMWSKIVEAEDDVANIITSMCASYCNMLFEHSTTVLQSFISRCKEGINADICSFNNFITAVIEPSLILFCLNSQWLHSMESTLPSLSKLLVALSETVIQDKVCRQALSKVYQAMYFNTIGPAEWRQLEGAALQDTNDIKNLAKPPANIEKFFINAIFTAADIAAWEVEIGQKKNTIIFGLDFPPILNCSTTSLFCFNIYSEGNSDDICLPNIYSGDLIRFTYDGPAGTVSCSVNRSDPIVIFKDVSGLLSPFFSSKYLDIKLIKAEKFVPTFPFGRDIYWCNEHDLMYVSSALSVNSNCVLHANISTASSNACKTARGSIGSFIGIQEWEFKLPLHVDTKIMCSRFGVIKGSSLVGDRPLGGIPNMDQYIPELAWSLNEGLWAEGKLVNSGFGTEIVKAFKNIRCVRMRIDLTENTIIFFVDNTFVGLAFGPIGSGAVFETDMLTTVTPIFPEREDELNVFPAASIFGNNQYIVLAAGGYSKSPFIIPPVLSCQRACSLAVSSLTAAMISGPSLSAIEKKLDIWLRSPLFAGGIESVAPCTGALISDKPCLLIPLGTLLISVKSLTGQFMSLMSVKDDIFTTVVSLQIGDTLVDSGTYEFTSRTSSTDSCFVILNLLGEIILNENSPALLSLQFFSRQSSTTSDKSTIACAILDISAEFSPLTAIGTYDLPLHPGGLLSFEAHFRPAVSKLFHTELKYNTKSIAAPILNDFNAQFLTDGSPADAVFFEWLERINPDPPPMKAAMMKSGQYSFPIVEKPLVLCLLKHGALVQEAATVCSNLTSTDRSSSDAYAPMPIPSKEMVNMWLNIKRLRTTLRQVKQKLKASWEDSKSIEDYAAFSESDSKDAEKFMENIATLRPIVHDSLIIGTALKWKRQNSLSLVRVLQLASRYCVVTYVGVDLYRTIVYVTFAAQRDSSNLSASNFNEMFANEFFLTIDNVPIIASSCECRSRCCDDAVIIVGLLRFNLSFERSSASGTDWRLCHREKENITDVAVLIPPLTMTASNGIDLLIAAEIPDSVAATDEKSVTRNDIFLLICRGVAERIMLLLSVSAASIESYQAIHNTSSFLKSLVEAASANTYIKSVRDLSQRKKKTEPDSVVSFLRRHYKLKQQVSAKHIAVEDQSVELESNKKALGDDLDRSSISISEMSNEFNIEDLSPVELMWHACIAFVTSGLDVTKGSDYLSSITINRDIQNIRKAINTREKKARQRIAAINTIADLLNDSFIFTDPLLVDELLSSLRKAFQFDVTKLSGAGVDAAPSSPQHRYHYLANLESCGAELLSSVQHSFIKLYSLLVELIHEYIDRWQLLSESSEESPNNELPLLAPQLIRLRSNDRTSSRYLHSKGTSHLDMYLKKEKMASAYSIAIRRILTVWNLDFSGRDNIFLVKSNISSVLQTMLSLSEQEAVSSEVLSASLKLAEYVNAQAVNLGFVTNAALPPNQRSFSTINKCVEEGIRAGRLTMRSLFTNLCLMSRDKLSCKSMQILQDILSSFLSKAADLNFTDFCKRCELASLSTTQDMVHIPAHIDTKCISKFLCLKRDYDIACAYSDEFFSLRQSCQDLLVLLALNTNDLVASGDFDTQRSLLKTISSNSSLADLDEIPPHPVLCRERTLFGTPKDATLEHGLLLREHIIAGLVQDVVVGTVYSCMVLGKDSVCSISATSCPPLEGLTVSAVASNLSQFVQYICPEHVSILDFESAGDSRVLNSIENIEIEEFMYQRLSTLSMLCALCTEFRSEISRSLVLKSLLSLLRIGTPRIRTEVCRILQYCISYASPDGISNAIPNHWLSSNVGQFCKQLVEGDNDIQSSSSPYLFLIGLLDIVASAVLPPPEPDDKIKDGQKATKPFGYGDYCLQHGQEVIIVLKSMISATKWSEIVTELFVKIIRFIESCVGDVLWTSASPWIRYGSAILAIVADLGVCCQGSLGILKDGRDVTVLSSNPKSGTVEVCSHNSNNDVCDDIEVVCISSVASLSQGTPVKLANAIFPVLLPLVTKVFTSSIWYPNDVEERTLIRFQSLLSQAFAESIESCNQKIVLSVFTKTDLIKYLMPFAMKPCPEEFSTLVEAKKQWRFIQARLIELDTKAICCSQSETENMPKNMPVISCRDAILESSDDVPFFVPSGSENPMSKDEQLSIIQTWIDKYGLQSVSYGKSLLDYFMHNSRSAEEYLWLNCNRLPELEKSFKESQGQCLFRVDSDIKPENVLLSSYPLPPDPNSRGMSRQNHFGLSFEKSDLVDASSFCAGDLVRVRETSSLRRVSIVEPGGLILSTLSGGSGIVTFESLKACDLEKVVACYGHKFDYFSLSRYMMNLDNCVSILCVRAISVRLLDFSRSNSFLVGRANNAVVDDYQILLFLKLLSASDTLNTREKIKKVMSSVFTAPLAGKTDLTASVICDLERQLQILVDPLGSPESARRICTDGGHIFTSIHPCISDHEWKGEINIPKHWRGLVVNFDSRCSMPKWSLHFSESINQSPFASLDDGMDCATKYLSTICPGQNIHVKHARKADTNGKLKLLAITGGVQPEFDDETSYIACEEFTVHTSIQEERSEDSSRAFIIPDQVSLESGVWFFECRIGSGNKSGGCDFGMIGVANLSYIKSIIPKSSYKMKGGCFLTSDGKVRIMHNDGSLETNLKDMKRVDAEISNMPIWEEMDFVGCLLEVRQTDNLNMCRIRFAVNGLWSSHVVTFPLSANTGVWPAFSMKGGIRFRPNLGLADFEYPPVLCLDTLDVVEMKFDQLGSPVGSCSSFFENGEVFHQHEAHPARSERSFANAANGNPTSIWWKSPVKCIEKAVACWGYSFSVQQIRQIIAKVVRDFKIVTAVLLEDGRTLRIWKPSTIPVGYNVTGHLMTETDLPPVGAIVVHDASVAEPLDYKYLGDLNGFGVWRPVAPHDYVALGDIISRAAGSSNKPLPKECMCVHISAVKRVTLRDTFCLHRYGIHLSTVQNCMQSILFSTSGMDQGYDVGLGLACAIRGHWTCEEDVNSNFPSIVWVLEVLDCLVNDPKFAKEVVRSSLCSALVKYVQSESCVGRDEFIRLLTKFLRVCRTNDVAIPFLLFREISTYLTKLISKHYPSITLPGAHLMIDFVTEIEANVVTAARINCQDDIDIYIKQPNTEAMDDFASYKFSWSKNSEYGEKKEETEFAESKDNADYMNTTFELTKTSPRCSKEWNHSSYSNMEEWWKVSIPDKLLRQHRLYSGSPSFCMKDALGDTESDLMSPLRYVLSFIDAFDCCSLPDQSFTISFPARSVTRAWTDHVRFCSLQETRHPYQPIREKFSRRVHFPGAKQLILVFDRRCSLGNSRLTLRFRQGCQRVKINLFGAEDDGNWPLAPIIADDECVTIEYYPGHSNRIDQGPDVADFNSDGLWGWSVLVIAKGNLYRTFTLHHPVPRHVISHGVIKDMNTVASSQSAKTNTDVEKLDTNIFSTSINHSSNVGAVSASAGVSTNGRVRLRGNRRSRPRAAEINLPVASVEAISSSLSGFTVECSARVSTGGAAVSHTNSTSPADKFCNGGHSSPSLSSEVAPEFVRERDPYIIFRAGQTIAKGTIYVPGNVFNATVSRPHPRQQMVKKRPVFCAMEVFRSCEISGNQIGTLVNVSEKPRSFGVDSSSMSYDLKIVPEALRIPDRCTGTTKLEAQPQFFTSPGATWSCPTCMKVNEISASNCGACRGNRPGAFASFTLPAVIGVAHEIMHSSSSEQDISNDELITPVFPALWQCTQCTFMNVGTQSNCSICDAVAPEEVPAAPSPQKSKRQMIIESDTSPDLAVNDKTDDALVFEVNIQSRCDEHGFWVKQALAANRWTPIDLMIRIHEGWDCKVDVVIIEHLSSLTGAAQQSIQGVIDNIATFVLPVSAIKYAKHGYSNFNLLEVQARVLNICYFNQHLEKIFPLINFRSLEPSSLGCRLRKCNQYILPQLKQPLLDSAISKSRAEQVDYVSNSLPASLILDNTKAMCSEDEKRIEPNTSTCCFVQAFEQLRAKDSAIYRYIFNEDCVFKVKFLNESGIDRGGVFREGVTRIIEDLFSSHFNLFLLCPNGVHTVFTNMEKYVPNPKHNDDVAIKMFEFVGKLIGMSIRAKLCLPFELPSVIWKGLIDEGATNDDFMKIDAISYNFLQAVRTCEDDGVNDEEAFSAKYGSLVYAYVGSDGIEKELIRGGKDIAVTFENRFEYCDKVLSARLFEFYPQIQAMRSGLLEVIPTNVLPLFAWQQFEVLVCGNPSFDIEVWKNNTVYNNLDSETVKFFWKVISSMTFKEQSGFVRFAWGRSRLPTSARFSTKMELCRANSNAVLPIAHTCFFQIEMPNYTSEDKMRHGLMTAIHFGGAGMLLA